MTTSPWDTRARSPSGWCARNVRMWDSWISAKFSDSSALTTLAGQQIHPVLAGQLRGPQAPAAVPDAGRQTRGVRLNPVGEDLDTRDAAEVGGRFPANPAQQPEHALVAEILDVGGIRVKRVFDLVIAHRWADADAGIQAASGQDVDGGEVLGESEWVLPAQGSDGRAELDAAGALRGRGQDRHR